MRFRNYLVVGGDGQLGSSLTSRLAQTKQHVHATYFFNDQMCTENSFLDLGGDISNWQMPEPIDVAFLCAAVTSLDQCRTQSEESRRINVENTLALAKRTSQTGAALFFPSTNLVFDGSIPFRKATDATTPQCEYGRQKVETEQGLAALTDKVAVIRFSKIIGPDLTLLKRWSNDLRQGRTIHPFSDMVLAPVSLRFATEVILAVMQKESYGFWQVSAAEDVTYEEMARHLARKIGAPQSLIAPVKVCESGLTMETIPEHTTLDTSRLKDELNINAPSVWNTLDEVII